MASSKNIANKQEKMSKDQLKEQLNDMYNKNWDSREYKDSYYGELNPENLFFMEQYFKYFSTLPELVKRNENERNVLELGSGPCICWGASIVAANFKGMSITFSDYVANNREDITKWMEKSEDRSDWSKQISYLSKLSGRSAAAITKELRSACKEVLPCDVRNKQPPCPIPGMESKYDVILTSLCYEACCVDMKEWKMAVINTVKLLKPGGILMIGGISNLSFYRVGDTDFPTPCVNEQSAKEVFADKSMGLEILKLESIPLEVGAVHGGADHDGVFFLIAKKN